MRALHEALRQAESEWCRELDIELHDVQFQLCEFDKYERIRRGEGGRKTKYVPGSSGKLQLGHSGGILGGSMACSTGESPSRDEAASDHEQGRP